MDPGVRDAIRRLWREVWVPSPADEGGYHWAVIAFGHVMLGAALAGILSGISDRILALIAYALFKEVPDIRRGGTIRDSLMDIGLVAVGLTYQGPWWWPVMIVAAVAVGAVFVEAKRV